MDNAKRQKILLITAAAAIAFYFGNMLVLEPMYGAWKGGQKKIADLRKQIEQNANLEDRWRTVEQRWHEMKSNSLPGDVSYAEQQMYQALFDWSQQNNVALSTLRPNWKINTDENFVTLECHVDATGNMEAITDFLYALEKGTTGSGKKLALKVQSLEVAARGNDPRQLNLGLDVSGLLLTNLPALNP